MQNPQQCQCGDVVWRSGGSVCACCLGHLDPDECAQRTGLWDEMGRPPVEAWALTTR